jgi:hypothetical protein
MLADTPGRRLKVLTAGLHQLGARCESLGGGFSADAAPSFVAASPWQANAGAVNTAGAGSRKDVAALAGRMHATGSKYAEVGTRYTETDKDGAAQLRELAG